MVLETTAREQELRHSQERLAHLNAVLRAVRNVNQLISREKQRDRLLEGACQCLVEARGYQQAWAFLRDGSDAPGIWAEAGVGESWPLLVERMRQGEVPPCIQQCLDRPGIVVADEQRCASALCPLCNRCKDTDAVAVRVQHGGEVHGVLAVTLPKGFARDPEEQALLEEVAGDVGFALHGIALEQQRALAEDQIRRQATILRAINEVFQEAFTCDTDAEVANTCLAMAEKLTQSEFGFINEINERGRCDAIVLTDPGWHACRISESDAVKLLRDMEIRGIWGQVLKDDRSRIVNNPGSHPSRVGVPEGHPPLRCFLGVPLRHGGKTIGLVGLANKESGYDLADQQAIEALSVGFVEALMRKRAEQALRDANAELREGAERLRFAMEGIGAGEWDLDLVDHTAFRSLRHDQIFGYETLLPQWTYEMFLEHVVPEDRELVDQKFHQAIAARRSWDMECRIVRRDKAVRWIRACGRPCGDASGIPRRLVGIVQDITDRKQAEEAIRLARDELESRVQERTAELAGANEGLKQERYLLHTLMDYLPHSIYFKDAESRFLRINKALANCFGLEHPSEAPGKIDLDFFTAEHASQALADEQEIVRTGRPILDKEERETWPDGRVTWASTTKMPLYDDSGKVVGTFGMSRDITDEKQAAEALRAAKEAAEAASRAKGTFLANMSHEIRTPLNAIIGMTELVLNSQVSAQQREFLTTVRDSGEALLSVINDILDFSKIEAGKLVLDRKAFDLRESLGDTMKSFAIRAHQQGLELACHIHPDVPRMLIGDYSRLRQIVVNLVGNAIKFTDHGEVVLEVSQESLSGEDVVLHFSVSDTGIGIPEEKRTTVFEMFEQADSSMTRRHGGTGLGLAIASRLVDLMGGRLWVESEFGRGSQFHFTAHLDLAEPETFKAIPAEPACVHGMRVLVVDDNATNRRILEEILRSWMMFPITARNASEAMEMLRQSQRAGEPCRLVLTDAHMPDVDGFTLAEEIKRDAEIGSTVVMMLTSGDRPEDTTRCEQLGIAAYLLKPIKQSELLEVIELALGITVTRKGLREPAGRQPSRVGRLRILLAEDSLVNQKLAVALLEGEGHTVSVASNGRAALTAIESEHFDLILMDVQMPEMDGLEATTTIRAEEKQTGRHIPIIAMTAHALKGDRERCLETGMDAYISKPIRADELFDTIEALFAAPGEAATSPATPLPERHIVDWPEALRAVRGDHRLLGIIVKAAVEEVPRLMMAIREAVTGGNTAELRLAAHTLKGAIRYFATGQVFEQAQRLEKMGQDKNLEGAQESLAALEAQMRLLVPVLSDYVRQDRTSDNS